MNRISTIDETDALHDDPEVVRVLEAYLAEMEAGRDPDRHRLLSENPKIADALNECLDGLDFLRRAADPVDWPNANRRLGSYRLLRVIGRGGMGTVYEAEELGTRRRLAVKVLPTATGGETELKRFRHEVRAAALLDHPHIVPVETVGEEEGVPYFAMKLVEGGSLAEWGARPIAPGRSTRPRVARDESTLPPAPSLRAGDSTASYHSNGRDPGYVAALLLQAADALAHAHAQGIVHRDVKPANLLLDTNDHLWVADFGLAFVPGLTRLTRSSAMIGTLRYMAPEQVEPRRGVVDHRADQYGLGATFYELLAGRPVFPDDDRGALVAHILADEPIALRRFAPEVPRDLETIIHVLMAKDPAKRYPSMTLVADDVRRWLDGKPIRARRPTWAERAASWLGRHRRFTATLLVGAISLIGALGWNQHRLRTERDRTRQEREEARRAVDDFWTAYSETVLDREPERDPLKREFLAKAVAHYDRLANAPTADWSDRFAAAVARRRLADVRSRLGAVNAAIIEYDAATSRLDDLLAERPGSSDVIRESAIVAADRGNLHRSLGNWSESGRDCRASADRFRALLDAGSLDPFDRAGLAGAENNQGLLWQSTDRLAEAEACFRSARARFAKLALERKEYLAPAAQATHNLAGVLAARGIFAEAVNAGRDARELIATALAGDPDSPSLRRDAARIALGRAELAALVGLYSDSLRQAEESVDLWRRLAREHPSVSEFAIGEAAAVRAWSIALANRAMYGEDADGANRTGRIGGR